MTRINTKFKISKFCLESINYDNIICDIILESSIEFKEEL